MSANFKKIQNDMYAIYFACKDPRVPWYAKALAVMVVAYLLSPVDLVPDFIPVLGYLDDLVIVPLGIALVIKLVPKGILAECRQRAADDLNRKPLPRNWVAGTVIGVIWVAVIVLAGMFVYDLVKG